MARAMSSLLPAAATLLLLLLLAAPHSSAAPISDEIQKACEFVTVPQLCTMLAVKSGATNLKELTVASVGESTTTLEEARATVARALADPITDKVLKGCLDVCHASFDRAVTLLAQAAANIKAGAYDNMVNSIQETVKEVGACNDAFSENPGLKSPVTDVNSMLRKQISNCLGLSLSLEVEGNVGSH